MTDVRGPVRDSTFTLDWRRRPRLRAEGSVLIYEWPWQRTGIAASLWCIIVGLAMMLVWLVEPMDIAERFPGIFGMKFNAALAFVLVGAAFLLALTGQRSLPVILMVPVFIYGALALSQHLFSIDVGIDTLLYTPFVDIRTSVPGRIAPNTSLCFMLMSTAMALRAISQRSSLPQTVLSFGTFTISAAALIGYGISLDFAHDWISYTRMSFQSASCFMVMSVALIFVGAHEAGYHRMALAALLGVVTYLILLTMSYFDLARYEELTGIAFSNDGDNARSTLSSLVLISGAVYGALVAHLYWSSRRARRMAGDLAESQARLAAIIDNAVDGIITIDDRGFILSANRACIHIFGYEPLEMIGRNVKMLMPEPYHTAHDGYLSNYERTGEAKVIGIGREVEGRRKDGSVFPLDLAVAKVEMNGATIYSGIVRDISERKRYEHALLEANAELEEFAYRTSHDLRSPIASSMGLLTISRDMLADGQHAALGGTLARMEKNFHRLDHLIQNIITLTRNRLMDEDNQTIRMRDLVTEVLEALSHLEDTKRIDIENHVDPELTIISKPSKFQVIVGNMLSNAIKYHDPKEANPRIDIRAIRYAGKVRISVEDNGLGIPQGSRHLLFKMFKRLHPNRSFGSGLGLYILKKSAESLDGTALYEARDKGSRFIIELPDGEKQ
jgi:PAS domain S-box-containing protein